MAQINVTVAGKTYPLTAGGGDEDRVRKLAAYVDSKAQELTGKLGHVNETRLILMAAMIIADELHDHLEGKGQQGLLNTLTEDDMAAVLDNVASDVEAAVEKLASE